LHTIRREVSNGGPPPEFVLIPVPVSLLDWRRERDCNPEGDGDGKNDVRWWWLK